jgi:hypothetical protein
VFFYQTDMRDNPDEESRRVAEQQHLTPVPREKVNKLFLFSCWQPTTTTTKPIFCVALAGLGVVSHGN